MELVRPRLFARTHTDKLGCGAGQLGAHTFGVGTKAEDDGSRVCRKSDKVLRNGGVFLQFVSRKLLKKIELSTSPGRVSKSFQASEFIEIMGGSKTGIRTPPLGNGESEHLRSRPNRQIQSLHDDRRSAALNTATQQPQPPNTAIPT